LTVDVEDYFHVSAFDAVVRRDEWASRESRVAGATDRLLDVLDAAEVKGTFFVLGWVAESFPALVRRIADRGHEIGSHSYAHQLVYTLTPDRFRDDLRRAQTVIEQATGRPVRGYRAPSYSITEQSLWALDVLIEEGYRYDSSIFPIRHDRYGIPHAPRRPHQVLRSAGSIWELPPATARWLGLNVPVAGGGYLRQFPYGVIRWGFAKLNTIERQPGVFYLHPWEIDPDQPRLPVGRLTGIRHYRNLHLTEPRLRRLLGEFRFGPISEVLKQAELATSSLHEGAALGERRGPS
jgi:polysaccharide deacetylase family protein (PEP-CTERM system associated)